MKRYSNIFLFAAVAVLLCGSVLAQGAEKKSVYQKLLSEKGLVKKEGFITLYKAGKELYLQIPVSFKGRLVLSDKVTGSANPDIPVGAEVSGNPQYSLEFTDSLVLFKAPSKRFVAKDEGVRIAEAMKKSDIGPVLVAAPIYCRNEDSSAVVIKADKLFDISSEDILSFKGDDFGSYSIENSSVKPESFHVKTVYSDSRCLAIGYDADVELSLATKMLVTSLEEKPVLPVSFVMTLTLIPESNAAFRHYDSRVGTVKVPYESFSSVDGSKTEYASLRYDFSQGMKVYVDTLLPASWRKAVKEGIEAWNPALKGAGIKEIEILPYPKRDPSFFANDPLVSTVSFAGQGSQVTYSLLPDPVNARILGFNINIPKNFIMEVRRSATYCISDVDPRYKEYFLEDSAITDVLRAMVMKSFGRCLGLTSNAAGSYAYTPRQLRDPAFTAAHGFSSSVTDDAMFNSFAQPGDKERGVICIGDRIGEYDRYAVRVLYDKAFDDEKALVRFIDSKSGAPEYFYASQVSFSPDPRMAAYGLGNDNVAAFEAGISHLKFVAANADKWLSDDRIPTESYSELFLDWIWIRYYMLTRMLSSNVGALMTNDVRPGQTVPKYSTVPASVQKKSLSLVFESYRDIGWLQDNRNLLHIAGANKDIASFNVSSLGDASLIFRRLPFVMTAERLAGSEYSVGNYMDDLRNEVMKNLVKGDLDGPGEETLVKSYLFSLIKSSPVLTANYKKAFDRSAFSEDSEFRISPGAVPEEVSADLDLVCRESLTRAVSDLGKGCSKAKDDYTRRRISLLRNIAESALGM